jgi:hypothetical protein
MKRLFILIIIAALAFAVESPARQQDRRARAITGRVVNDGGQPIANAVVYFNRVGNRPGANNSTGTDEQGNFRAEDLANGAYVVSAMVPGFVPASDETEPQYYRVGDWVTLTMTKGGVITGAVTNSLGEPVVAARVRAIRVRETDGRAARSIGFSNERATDDRGVYRLYGLRSGAYIVAVTGQPMFGFGPPSLYDGNAPTYYPSSTRDTAVEVTVRAGDEASNIDIRYRGERGHAVSGTLTGATEGGQQMGGISVSLAHASSGMIEAQEFVQFRDKTRSFAFYGVPDGEYDVMARRGGEADSAASVPRRIAVKGGDVTGLELELAPLGSIAGSVVIEPLKEGERKPECGDKRQASIEEIVIAARRDDKGAKPEPLIMSRSYSSPNDKGEFTLFNLRPGLFRIQPRLPVESWYVRSINLIAPAATGKPKVAARDAARSGLQLSQGERLTGLAVIVAEGAAFITGKILPAKEGQPIPSQVRVYLVPAEPEMAEDAIRYREALATNDATFTLANLAPGRYYILAKEVSEASPNEDGARPAAWDQTARSAIRREAEAANQTIELQPCRRLTDYSLRMAAAKPAAKKS